MMWPFNKQKNVKKESQLGGHMADTEWPALIVVTVAKEEVLAKDISRALRAIAVDPVRRTISSGS